MGRRHVMGCVSDLPKEVTFPDPEKVSAAPGLWPVLGRALAM